LQGGGRGQRAVARGLEDAEKAREQSQPQKQAQMLISVIGRWWWWPEGSRKGFEGSGKGQRVSA